MGNRRKSRFPVFMLTLCSLLICLLHEKVAEQCTKIMTNSKNYVILYLWRYAYQSVLSKGVFKMKTKLSRLRKEKEEYLLKKKSKATKKIILNALVIFFTIGIVLYLGAKEGDIGNAWDALTHAETGWVLAAIGSLAVFLIFEAMVVHAFFLQQKVKVKFRSTFIVSLIGMFYSNVTPAATGGQPMQVFAFKRRGVPTGVATSALTVKFFCYQVALLTMGTILWATHRNIVAEWVSSGKVIIITGFIINSLTVAAVVLFAIDRRIVNWFIKSIIKLGHVLHIVKDQEKSIERAEAAVNDFHESVSMVAHNPKHLIELVLLSCLQILGLMSIAYFVYRAMGQTGVTYPEILTLQFLLYIGASFTPLPGASGAQEGGFYLFFRHVFPDEKLLGALLLWRFFTYYITLIIGLGAVVLDSSLSVRQARKEALPQEGKDSDDKHLNEG